MKHIIRTGGILALFFVHVAYGQQAPKPASTSTGATLLTADSLASGNYKDILSSFYQLAVTNLTGPNKELKFTANPYAIMLRHDSTLAQDVKFQRLRPWRKLNFTVDAKLDSAMNFNGVSLGAVYALVDRRDVTVSRAFHVLLSNNANDNAYAALLYAASLRIDTVYGFGPLHTRDSLLREARDSTLTFDKLDPRIQAMINAIFNEDTGKYPAVAKADVSKLNAVSNKQYAALLDSSVAAILANYKHQLLIGDTLLIQENLAAKDSTLTFQKLDARLQKVITDIIDRDTVSYGLIKKALADNPNLNVYTERNKGYHQLIKEFQNKPLWTVGVADTSYKTGLFTKALTLYTEYSRGLDTSDRVNWELDLKPSYSFLDDTLHSGMNLQRQVLNFTYGVNIVLRGKTSHQPYVELKLSGSYNNICHGSLYKNENQITNTANAQLMVRIYKDIWLPLQISYDTKTHNVLGFLNVTTNFTALGSMFKSGNAVNTKS